jgi:hypothetical protein
MKPTYKRPTIIVKNWLVTKDDLKKINDFLIRRYKVSSIEFSLTTTSGNNKIYESFKEFEDDIDNLRTLKENVESIDMGHNFSDYSSDKSNSTNMSASINFSGIGGASFYIRGEGDSEIKDWIDGSFEEMKRIAQSFELEDKRMIKLLKSEFGENWLKGTVVEDFGGEIKNKLKLKLKKVVSKINWYTTWWGRIIIGVIIVVIGGLILNWLGYIFSSN